MSEHQLQTSHTLGVSISDTASYNNELDDTQLVAACKKGDQDAFALLVQRHQRRVFNIVYRMLQQYEEANEVTQETFLAAWQGLHTFRGDAQFSTWLYRIAYNCALKQLQLRKHDSALQATMQAEQALEMANSENQADAAIETHERQEMIQEQISSLPNKYRIVLILRHIQDMTYEEMAEILSVPVGTIKTHLFRARNLLKERLEGFDRDRKAKRDSL